MAVNGIFSDIPQAEKAYNILSFLVLGLGINISMAMITNTCANVNAALGSWQCEFT